MDKHIIDLVDHPTANSNLKVSTFRLARNKRPDSTPAGTRAASAVAYVGNDFTFVGRTAAEKLAREAAVTAWENVFGPMPWDEAEFIGAHLSFQVIYEVRVCPR